jgi:hypothetical protein
MNEGFVLFWGFQIQLADFSFELVRYSKVLSYNLLSDSKFWQNWTNIPVHEIRVLSRIQHQLNHLGYSHTLSDLYNSFGLILSGNEFTASRVVLIPCNQTHGHTEIDF